MTGYVCMRTCMYHCAYDGIQDASHGVRRRENWPFSQFAARNTHESFNLVIDLTTVSFEMQCATSSENVRSITNGVYDDGLPNSLIG